MISLVSAGSVFTLLSDFFIRCWDFMFALFDSTSMLFPYYAAIGIFMIYRFLLMPAFGGAASSDKARKPPKEKDIRKEDRYG